MITGRVRVTEVFFSLQGESLSAGCPTVFVRLTGCPLRCTYCDTAYAFSGGTHRDLNAVVADVARHPTEYVCVTGGEPLAQPSCRGLLRALCDHGYRVSLETSGALPCADIDPRVSIVMDLKTPGSGESHRNHWENMDVLTQKDQVKFVVSDRQDYDWARFQMDRWRLSDRVGAVLLSPVWQALEPRELAGWMVADGLRARLQLQLHKLLWGEVQGR